MLPLFFDKGDVMALDITPDGFFNPSLSTFTIMNSYSTKAGSNNTGFVPADLIFPQLPGPTLTLGDLNIPHATADPLRGFQFKEDELATSIPYFHRARELGFSLLNTRGVYSRFSMSLLGRPGVLDVAFACALLAPYFSEWSDPLPSTGSDHIPILLRFEASLFRAPPPKPNRALTHWPQVDEALKSMDIPPPPPPPDLPLIGGLVRYQYQQNLSHPGATLPPQVCHTPVQAVVDHNALGMLKGLPLHTPGVQKRTPRFLPPGVGQSRPVLLLQGNKEGEKGLLVRVLVEGYSADSLDSKEICHRQPPPRFPELPRASTPLELNTALLHYFFPGSLVEAPHTILLAFKEVLALEASEIDRALARWSPSSAPGPDKTPNSVWKCINKVAPALILNLLAPLLSYGYNPHSLKRADGIVLDKPGKPSDHSPSSF